MFFYNIFYMSSSPLSTASFTHVTWSWYLLILSCCHVSRFTVQSVQSCQRATFHCVHLWQRTESVVEIKIGKPAPNNEDACLEQLFFDDSIPIQTITGNLTHNSKVMMITVTVIMMSEFGWHSLCWAEFWTYFELNCNHIILCILISTTSVILNWAHLMQLGSKKFICKNMNFLNTNVVFLSLFQLPTCTAPPVLSLGTSSWQGLVLMADAAQTANLQLVVTQTQTKSTWKILATRETQVWDSQCSINRLLNYPSLY